MLAALSCAKLVHIIKKLVHAVADNDLHHYAFYEKRNTARVMGNFCKAFSQGMCKSHMPKETSLGASGRKPLRFYMGKHRVESCASDLKL